jgi:hypothetical protein
MKAVFVVMAAIFFSFVATAQTPNTQYKSEDRISGQPDLRKVEGVERIGSPRGSTTADFKAFPLTNTETDVVFRATMKGATVSDIQMATDICSKKCKECVNGAECNLECVKKTCVKAGPNGR